MRILIKSAFITPSMPNMGFEQLLSAVDGDAVALRSTTTLQPAGGIGDKIFPPSYAVEDRAKHKYAVETRRLEDGTEATSVLLDSIASQANRAELALLEGYRQQELSFPVPYVNFGEHKNLAGYDKLTVLETPHRIADAIFRDSLLEGKLFRFSDVGKAITDATPRNATALFRYSPTSLLFGMWDSTGLKGGLGSKFQRAYVSEIVGHGAVTGSKVKSRLDPLQIDKVAEEDRVFNANGDELWTDKTDKAAKDKNGKLEYASRGSDKGKPGQPAKINHGNIAPSIDSRAGGVTVSKAVQTMVLSFATLRKLHFQGHGTVAESAARAAIAALGIAAIVYQRKADFDLRSRCLLIPTGPMRLEMLYRDGTSDEVAEMSVKDAASLLAKAATHAKKTGIGWEEKEIILEPAPKLIELITRSRKNSANT